MGGREKVHRNTHKETFWSWGEILGLFSDDEVDKLILSNRDLGKSSPERTADRFLLTTFAKSQIEEKDMKEESISPPQIHK